MLKPRSPRRSGDRSLRRAAAACGLAAVLLASASSIAADAGGAEAALAAVEQRLLEADRISLRFDIRSVGVVAASLTGSAAIGPGNDARIDAEGEFGGAPAAISLEADSQSMRGGNGDSRFEADTAPALREALVVGLVRMGLLHNLAMLSAGQPPDRIDGTARQWVTYRDVTMATDHLAGGIAARRFQFTVVVDGEPAAIADLWVDEATGLPLRRTQVVNFAEGEMRVLEQYPEFDLQPGG